MNRIAITIAGAVFLCGCPHTPRGQFGTTAPTPTLKDAYAAIVNEGQGLTSRYLPQMQEQARTLDAGKVMAMVRGRA